MKQEDYVADHVPLGRRLTKPSVKQSILRGKDCRGRRSPRNPSMSKKDLVARMKAQKYYLPIGKRRKEELCDIVKLIREDGAVEPKVITKAVTSKTPVLTTVIPNPKQKAKVPKPSAASDDCFDASRKFPLVKLHQHQQRVVRRILAPDCKGLLLNFKVGSGKTISSIAAAEALRHKGTINGVVYIGAKTIQKQVQRDLKKTGASDKDWKFSTAQLFLRRPLVTKRKLLVVDEAHAFRKESGSMTTELRKAARQATKVLLLTGTPVVNWSVDLRPLISMISTDNSTAPDEYNHQHIGENLRKIVRCNFLYYKPDHSNKEYPDTKTDEMFVELSPKQSKHHWQLGDKNSKLALLNKHSLTVKDLKALTAFLGPPRQVCNAYGADAPKLEAIANHIVKDVKAGHKVVAYSFYLERGVDVLSQLLTTRGIKHELVTGKITDSKRIARIAAYNEDRVKVLLFTGAIKEGIDLLHTGVVHVCEPAFHEAGIQQVIGRAVRQNSHTDPKVPKLVKVYRWIGKLNAKYIETETAGKKISVFRKQSADQIIANIAKSKEVALGKFLDKIVQISASGTCETVNCRL